MGGPIEKCIFERSREKRWTEFCAVNTAAKILSSLFPPTKESTKCFRTIVDGKYIFNLTLSFLNKVHDLIIVGIVDLIADNYDWYLFLRVEILFDEVE